MIKSCCVHFELIPTSSNLRHLPEDSITIKASYIEIFTLKNTIMYFLVI